MKKIWSFLFTTCLVLLSILILLTLVGASEANIPIKLTDLNVAVETPSITDDGSKIAFHAILDEGPEIFVVNSDGSGLKQLTSNSVADYSPSISDDGSKIAFVSNVDDAAEVFVINSDGSGLFQFETHLLLGFMPAISDDGSKIAFDAAELYSMADIYVVSYDVSSSEPAPDLESNNDENCVYLVLLALGIIFGIVLTMVFIRRKNLI